ncbi:hypothetical protein TVAG_035950 [Trichomonas vaginalis G3]|uniref:Uncharacterized protein n=1 Tax=Trichomonas vaginalis (strain ATCC PRA-98 / G3) TaxID=412133 RepID=A2DAR7_TRIV3|nr:hypothetical protein TVAGG3_0812400 [Trichomonas vaginalis G3]EAY22570.1 hypothetical protein TVAG_035950 [Trichomonas vaginalis G3]KAI5497302.1 hypothetical protein TVAGG3_0812400 [Trichomonas vaginalis G3]|eukprot:XP_001583556.1 hypothetical protein [Trichomonas vaginalis G3]
MLLPALILAAASVQYPFNFRARNTQSNAVEGQKVALSQNKAFGKPLNTQTPKPSITKFRKLSALQGANIPMEFPTDSENSNSIAEEIKQQLVSTPMIIFYSVLSLCIIIAIGIFMFYKDPEDDAAETTQDAIIENQLHQVLDSKLENETMVI